MVGLTFAEALGFGSIAVLGSFLAGLGVGLVLVFVRRLRDVA